MRIGTTLGLLLLFLAPIQVRAQAQPFVGQIAIVGFNFAPPGWLPCDGRLLPISEFEVLYNLIGTTYGGNGETNFALPDLRGRIAVGMGQGPRLQNYILGQIGGEEQVTLILNQVPVHSHAAIGTSGTANALGPGGTEWATTPTFLYSSTGTASAAMNSAAIGAVGGGQPHENRPPYLAMNFIIAWAGIYPSQD